MVPPTVVPTAAPAFIPIGTIRHERQPYARPSQVHTARDLPRRVYLGDIVPSSFVGTPSVWRVEYADSEPQTGVVLSYDRLTGAVELRQQWRGIPGPTRRIRTDHFPDVATADPSPFPVEWDKAAVKRLEALYNLQYFPVDQTAPYNGFFFPDGALKSVYVPIPVCRLREVVNLFHRLQDDTEGVGLGTVSLVRTTSAINYVVGRCSEQLTDPIGVWCHVLETTGFGQGMLPSVEQADDGSRALSIGRAHYLAVVSCTFRDLERVVAHIHALRLLGSADAVDEPLMPTEHRAIVGQIELEAYQAQLNFWDNAKSRRITYDPLVPKEVWDIRASADFDGVQLEDTLRFIEQAEAASRQFTDKAEDILNTIVGRYRKTIALNRVLKQESEVSAPDEDGNTLLHWTAEEGNTEALLLLLERGADIDRRTANGETALHLAAGKGRKETVDMLLQHGADIHAQAPHDGTPLHFAVRNGHVEVAELLYLRGADLNVPDADGWSPLLVACEYGTAEMANVLLENGADVSQCDGVGRAPLHYAAGANRADIVILLLENGVDPNVLTEQGQTALHGVGDCESAEILLQRGADATIVDASGRLASDYADGRGRGRLYHLLRAWERRAAQTGRGTRGDEGVSASVETAANAVRSACTTETQYLCPPHVLEDNRLARSFKPWLRWGIFNPMGPTIMSVGNVIVPQTGERLVIAVCDHHMVSWAVVYGLLPPAADPVPTLTALFTANGCMEYALVLSLPHYVDIMESPVSRDLARRLLRAGWLRVCENEPERLSQAGDGRDGLRDYFLRPWDLATAEMDRGLERLGTTDQTVPPPSVEEACLAFDEWFELATDPESIRVYHEQMPAARRGAVEFLRGGFSGAG